MKTNKDGTKQRLIIFDIDGTLLPIGKKEISPKILEFLKSLSEKNILITFSTGKSFILILHYAQYLNINLPLICCNGALIKHPVTKEIIFSQTLDRKIFGEIIKLACNPDNQLYFEINEIMYFVNNPKIPPQNWRHVTGQWKVPAYPYEQDSEMLKTFCAAPNKVTLVATEERIPILRGELKKKFGDNVNLFSPKKDVIDITDGNVNKGTAVKILAKKLGLKLKDIIAVGDELNDLSMLKIVGTKIAIKSAPKEVIDEAAYIIDGEEGKFIKFFNSIL